MVAFALRADGWYLRQDIIWAKPNPMPESVTDRCTKAHEYVFMLAKSARYFWDAEAMKEELSRPDLVGALRNRGTNAKGNSEGKMRNDGDRNGVPYSKDGLRNRRSVWTVATQPYSGAHFATFPPALIEPMILSGSRPGDIVLDPFGGSGTTMIAAERTGRRAVLLEIDPAYADVIVRRWQETTGEAAVLDGDERVFADIAACRAAAST